jgi:hypothetical protein
MKQAFFWCYPGDIDAEGYAAALGRMAGDIGVDAISVAATTHHVVALHPRSTDGPHTVTRESAAHFRPSADRYAGTRLRPIPARWMKSRNPLEKIARAAEKTGLAMRIWAVCCQSDTLARQHPMAQCVDVFGDAIAGWLCPTNPDVREYVGALVEDLSANYPVETLELIDVGFDQGSRPARHTELGWTPTPSERALLSWCFCASCRQKASEAGTDVEQVRSVVEDLLTRAMRLDVGGHDSLSAVLAENELLAAYKAMRDDVEDSLLRMVRKRTTVRLVMHAVAGEPGTARPDRASHLDGLVRRWDQDSVANAGASAGADVMHIPHPPETPNGPALVSEVHKACEAGHERVGFFHYGITPEPCLDWVRQAIRYARRESGR